MGSPKEERKFDSRGSSGFGASLQDNQADGVGGVKGSSKALCQAIESRVDSQLEKIDVRSLPCVLYSEVRKVPKKQGIYFIFRGEECLYIGMSINLRSRLGSHNLLVTFKKNPETSISWLEYEDSATLDEAEVFFIKKLNPVLNKMKHLARLSSKVSKTRFLKLPIQDFSLLTGIEPTTLAEWFDGSLSPTIETLERVAFDLKMPVTELFEAFLERRSRTMQLKESKSA